MSQSFTIKDARTELILDALRAYRDDDNDEYNIEIDALIDEIKHKDVPIYPEPEGEPSY